MSALAGVVARPRLARTASFAIALLLLLSVRPLPCAASPDDEEQKQPGSITATMRAEDARLGAKITLKHQRVRMDELLKEIAGQAKVKVEADPDDGAADVHVQTYCTDLALGDAMNALWSLLSYRKGEWAWERKGEPQEFTYRLTKPVRAQKYEDGRRDWIWGTLRNHLTLVLGAVDGTDQQKSATLQTVYGDLERTRDPAVAARIWAGARLVRDKLTPAQIKQVLRGRRFTLPLPSAGGEAPQGAAPGPDATIEVSTRAGIPCLVCIVMAYTPLAGQSGFSGTGTTAPIAGGAPIMLGARRTAYADWMLDGDAKDDPLAGKLIGSYGPDEPQSFTPPAGDYKSIEEAMIAVIAARERGPDPPQLRIEHIAVTTGVPVFARLHEERSEAYLSEATGKTIKEFWAGHWNPAISEWACELMPKWRDGVLLVTPIVFVTDDPPVPAKVLKALRKDAKPGQLLPLADLTAVADLLTSKQLLRLKREFPVMAEVESAKGLLTFLHRFPGLARQAQSGQGLAIDGALRAAVDSIPELADEGFWNVPDARYLTIGIGEALDRDPPARTVQFWVLDGNGQRQQGRGFKDVAQPKLEAKEGEKPK